LVAKKYRLTRPLRPIDLPGRERPSAIVWVESSDYDEDGVLHIEGEESLVEKIRQELLGSYGNRARPLMEGVFSPRDLACALDGRFMKPFEAVEIQVS